VEHATAATVMSNEAVSHKLATRASF